MIIWRCWKTRVLNRTSRRLQCFLAVLFPTVYQVSRHHKYLNYHYIIESTSAGAGDLATKVVEQLVEADAARENTRFGTHLERHQFSGDWIKPDIEAVNLKL